MSTAIDIRNVVKRYGLTTALHGISLTIADNEFFTLLGPSGCGKTTLLRCIAGFEDVSEGDIQLFGQNIAGLEPNQRPVNTVFQQYALFPHMSVVDNVAFGLKMKGVGPEDRRRRAGRILGRHQQRTDQHVRAARLADDRGAEVVVPLAELPQPPGQRTGERRAAVDHDARRFAAGVGVDDADALHGRLHAASVGQGRRGGDFRG